MDRVFESSRTTALIILAFAAVQIVVHIIYFPVSYTHLQVAPRPGP